MIVVYIVADLLVVDLIIGFDISQQQQQQQNWTMGNENKISVTDKWNFDYGM